MSRTPEPQPVSPPAPAALAAFEAALTRPVGSNTAESGRDLVAALRGMDAAGESAAALRRLAGRPRVVLRLDVALRRTAEVGHGHAGTSGHATGGRPALAADTSPLGIALASCHPDGRMRELAVARLQLLLRRPQVPCDLVPFLVLRSADWAGPVQDRARAARVMASRPVVTEELTQ